MADNFMRNILILAVLYYLFIGSGAQTQTPVVPDEPGTGNQMCAYAPTVELLGVDKYDDSAVTSSTYKYKLNGGAVQTDSDGVFEVVKGDTLEVLWGHNNATEFTPDTESYTIDKCGLNQIHYTGLLKNDTFTIQCFNQEGNVIDDTSEYETIGTGEAPTLRCEIHSKSKRGLPFGAVMTLELNGTEYKENEVVFSGLGSISGDDLQPGLVSQALSAYTLNASDNRVVGAEVAPFEGAIIKEFTVYLPAEDTVDPLTANYPVMKLHPVACYHEEDVTGGDLRCGVTDLDNTYVAGTAGYENLRVD